MELTICIFAWNEVETAASVVHEIAVSARRLDVPFEIVLIDDGSTDGTSEAFDRLAEEITEARVIHHAKNEGLGPVYRTGFEAARGEYLTFFPADGQFPATIIEDFFPRMASLDLCLGYLPGRTDAVGRALSGVERMLYRMLLGRLPRFQGIFMIRTAVLRSIPLESRGRGWAIVMELLLRAARRKHRIESFPTSYRPRIAGHSKVNNWKSIQANLRQLIALRKLVPRSG